LKKKLEKSIYKFRKYKKAEKYKRKLTICRLFVVLWILATIKKIIGENIIYGVKCHKKLIPGVRGIHKCIYDSEFTIRISKNDAIFN